MPEPKNKIKTEVSVKLVKRGEWKPEHPLYQTFCYQISAALGVARQIAADGGNAAFVQRFLDEFERKTA